VTESKRSQNPKRPLFFSVSEWLQYFLNRSIIAFTFLITYDNSVSATEVIDEIKHLPPGEQAEVIRFAIALAHDRQCSGEELGRLAEQLAQSDNPAEIARLRSAMTRGFYGA
jgi:hypothetical protein